MEPASHPQTPPQTPTPAAAKAPPRDLEDLFQRHHGLVFQAAYRITGSSSDAEDVLQTVFLRLLKREGGGIGVDRLQPNPEGYLHRSAVNAALDLVRARARSRQVPFENSIADRADSSRRGPEGAMRDRELRDWLRRAVAGLGGRAAEVFALRYLEGMSNPQIAGLLGTSQAVIAVTLHRTRGRLRKEIRPLLGD
ncbi:MAG: sigma-70 family RNA polymerase sigma factor [Acidobacteriota bacterium]